MPGTMLRSRFRSTILAAALLLSLAPAFPAAPPPPDEFLRGYLTALLEREMGLSPERFSLEVSGGVARVRLPGADEALRRAVEDRLSSVRDLADLIVLASPPAAPTGKVGRAVYTVREALGLTSESAVFPAGDVFQPLMADVKQPQFFVGIRRFQTFGQTPDPSLDTFTMAAVAYGGGFGLHRRLGRRPGEGLQVGMDGALFAQFDMDAPSHDLLNADYTVGIPITYRERGFSARLRLYHQSSHLGDEFLLRYRPDRINLSYEAVQLTLSGDNGSWRLYGGGEWLMTRDPPDLQRGSLQTGLEFRGSDPLLWGGRPVAALDVKSYGENGWTPSYSFRAGLEFGPPDLARRHLRLMAEGYRGFAPYGQFYREKVEYVGLAVTFNY